MTGSSARDWTTPGGLTTDEHPQSSTTCRAKPSRAKRGSAVNRALRARIRRKLEAIKQEAIQLPRISCLGRRESVLCTNGIDPPT